MAEYLVKGSPKRQPTHPGAILREDVLPALEISVSEFARRIGVSRQVLHRILAESHGITPEMALRIGEFVGNGADLWLRMQQDYDLWQARRALKPTLDRIRRSKAA
jgi:addiction module HigA family antidote